MIMSIRGYFKKSLRCNEKVNLQLCIPHVARVSNFSYMLNYEPKTAAQLQY